MGIFRFLFRLFWNSMSQEYDTIVNQRAAVLTRMQNWIAFTELPEFELLNVHQAKTRIDRGQEIFKLVEQAQLHMIKEAKDQAERDRCNNEMMKLEDEYIASSAKLVERYSDLQRALERNNMEAAGNAAQALMAGGPEAPVIKVQLPVQQHNIRNTWGNFDGNLLKWKDFRERFEAAVDKNADIGPVYKLWYLKQSLQGQAAEVLAGWQIDGDSYQGAWERLNERYDKPYPLARAYLRHFFSLKEVGTPVTANDFRRLSDGLCQTVRNLKGVKYPVEQWDMILIHMIQERLDGPSASAWNLRRGDNNTPTVEDMVKFLDERNDAANEKERNAPTPASASATNKHASRSKNRNNSNASSRDSRASSSRGTGRDHGNAATPATHPKVYPCTACNSKEHKIFDCPEFEPLSYAGRSRVAEMKGICRLCLKRGHHIDRCYDMTRCKDTRCEDKRHNSMLCPNKTRTHVAMTATDSNRNAGSSNHSRSGSKRRNGTNE